MTRRDFHWDVSGIRWLISPELVTCQRCTAIRYVTANYEGERICVACHPDWSYEEVPPRTQEGTQPHVVIDEPDV